MSDFEYIFTLTIGTCILQIHVHVHQNAKKMSYLKILQSQKHFLWTIKGMVSLGYCRVSYNVKNKWACEITISILINLRKGHINSISLIKIITTLCMHCIHSIQVRPNSLKKFIKFVLCFFKDMYWNMLKKIKGSRNRAYPNTVLRGARIGWWKFLLCTEMISFITILRSSKFTCFVIPIMCTCS